LAILNGCSSISPESTFLKGSNFLTLLVEVYLDHLPSEHDIYASLVAFFKGNLVGIWELEDLLVWGPVLDSGTKSAISYSLCVSGHGFVIKGIKTRSLTLEREFWVIADHISVGMVTSVIVILVKNSILGIKHMGENTNFITIVV